MYLLVSKAYIAWHKNFQIFGTIQDLYRTKWPKKLTNDMEQLIDSELKESNKLTSQQLLSTLKAKYPQLRVSLPTIRRTRKKLGWVCTKPHYCQSMHNLNKHKCFLWYQFFQKANKKYENVIFMDKCTIQLERHSRLCFRKNRQCRWLRPWPKHLLKLHTYVFGVESHFKEQLTL